MHYLLLQDTHEDLTFVKSLHIVLKYFLLPDPIKRQLSKNMAYVTSFDKNTSSFFKKWFLNRKGLLEISSYENFNLFWESLSD